MTKLSVQAKTYSGEESSGDITIESFTPAQRTRRTLLRTGSVLLGTALGAIIPVAHFVIVPVGIITAIILFFRTSSTAALVTGGDLSCPACREKVAIYPRPLKLPMKESCDHCHREIQVFSAGN